MGNLWYAPDQAVMNFSECLDGLLVCHHVPYTPAGHGVFFGKRPDDDEPIGLVPKIQQTCMRDVVREVAVGFVSKDIESIFVCQID